MDLPTSPAGALCVAALGLVLAAAPALAGEPYIGRPVYSEPGTGLQLPPGCSVDPTWRTRVAQSDFEVWVTACDGGARVWLVRRQVVEIVNGRQSRLRFEILDERDLPEETAGDSLSVQCSGPHDETGYVVRGAHWRSVGKELRLHTAHSVLRADISSQKLVDADMSAVDCVRFPEREQMMRRLQSR